MKKLTELNTVLFKNALINNELFEQDFRGTMDFSIYGTMLSQDLLTFGFIRGSLKGGKPI